MAYDTKVALVACGALPIGLGSSGTIGANGALTLTTGLAQVYPNIYLYFPVGALFANSPAGFYYTQMSSGTQGTVYNNPYVSGVPAVPAVLNPIVNASVGAYTQVTTLQTLLSITLPGNSMGANGSLQFDALVSINNSANNKTVTIPWGGGNLFSLAATTNALILLNRSIVNRGVTNSQSTAVAGVMGPGVSAGNVQLLSLDTTVNQNLTITGTLANATDFLILDHFRIQAFYA